LKLYNTLIVPVTNGPGSVLTIEIMKWYFATLSCSLACFLGQVVGDFVIVQVGSSRTLSACPPSGTLDADCNCFTEGTGAEVSGIDVGDAYSTSNFAIREGLCGKGRLECRETNSGGISYLKVYLRGDETELASCYSPDGIEGGQCTSGPSWTKFFTCIGDICKP
jgi:hypothetical protein